MKITIYLLLFIVLVSFTPYKEDDLSYIYNQIMDTSIKHPKAKDNIHRKVLVLYDASKKYGLPTKVFTRICRVESHFKRTALNKGTDARGLFQITDCWNSAIWYIDDKELGKHINKKGIKNINRYKHRIYYGAELGAYALKACIKHKKGNLTNAILMFGGWYSKNADMKKATNYLNKILAINE
jgi:hypothetical protein